MVSSILNPLRSSGARILDKIYPPRCFACSEETDQPHGLCAACWSEVTFISGCVCETCGVPVAGDAAPFVCDACLTFPPPWKTGRAVMLYEGSGRKIILSLKNSDRTDIARPLSVWMARTGEKILETSDLLVPVPLHWKRLFQRGYNQSAILSAQLAKRANRPNLPDLLKRNRHTPTQNGRNRVERIENQRDAIEVSKRHAHQCKGKTITLIDDVMTTGATLSACASVLSAAGAAEIRVLVLARVAREPL